MRVIAGRLGGRVFESPHGHRTHPMSEKMRGAIFGALGDVRGLTVLDAFAGSGALAIEAISRGAASALAIDADKKAHASIVKNIQELAIEGQIKAVRAYANAWSMRHQAQHFDLIFLDPPYNDIPWRDLKVLPRHLAEGGTLVLSWPGPMDPWKFEGLQMVLHKNYGDGQLVFYQAVLTRE